MGGSKGASLWGSGTYFARDAKYVADGSFCKREADGTRQMLACLAMTGMPCLGDPEHKGVLPMRQGVHRYNSTVDSLSNPEILFFFFFFFYDFSVFVVVVFIIVQFLLCFCLF